jgi:hypothetical protein
MGWKTSGPVAMGSTTWETLVPSIIITRSNTSSSILELSEVFQLSRRRGQDLLLVGAIVALGKPLVRGFILINPLICPTLPDRRAVLMKAGCSAGPVVLVKAPLSAHKPFRATMRFVLVISYVHYAHLYLPIIT